MICYKSVRCAVVCLTSYVLKKNFILNAKGYFEKIIVPTRIMVKNKDISCTDVSCTNV